MTKSHETPPAFRAPKGACDTHFHVFGPLERYPVASRARYQPPLALLSDYLEHCEAFGIERMVFVQPSAYGTDNRCMLDAMIEVDAAKRRGIVDIDEDVSDDEIQRLHDLGTRGVRINTSPVAPFNPQRVKELQPKVDKLAHRLAGSGWCLEFLGPGWLTEAMMPLMRGLPLDYVICHLGMFPAATGPDQQGYRDLLKLAERPNCWLKLTGIYRFSQTPGFTDAAPMVHAAYQVAPERLIWGSDYPHLSFADRVGSTELFNLLLDWFPDEKDRHQVLVDNPARLFKFA